MTWIKTQDYEIVNCSKLKKISYSFVYPINCVVGNYFDNDETNIILGEYDSKEICLEVIDYITSSLFQNKAVIVMPDKDHR